jgi:putative cell wall-binding protein
VKSHLNAGLRLIALTPAAFILAGLCLVAPAGPAVQPAAAVAIVVPTPITGWGGNGSGQTTIPAGLERATAIAAGELHSLALLSDGTVAAWGNNSHHELDVPSGLTGVTAVAAGRYYFSLAVKSDGTVVGWGSNDHGETTIPADLTNPGTAHVTAVAAGCYHSLALKSNGTVVAWGWNNLQQFDVPAGLTNVKAIAAGCYYSMALKGDGTVVAWGANGNGQTNTSGLSGITAIAAGFNHGVALKSDGTVTAWGYNFNGETIVPAALTSASTAHVTAISAGGYHNLALQYDGTVVAWGRNTDGESTVPAGLMHVGAIAAGAYHSLTLTPSVVRYSGAGRFATAAAISRMTFTPGVDVAYIAYAYNFPDALAGAAAAGWIKGPVLLANTTGAIDSYTAAELERVQPVKIVVLGSTGVISAQVATDLAAYAGAGGVVRYSGAGRFATAAAISAKTFAADCGCTAYIAYAYNFPDALAGAAAAGYTPGPVLLVNTSGAIDPNTVTELQRLKPTTIAVLGSTGVISAQVATDLVDYAGIGGVVRYSGAGRFATAADISSHTFSGNCGCVAYIAYAYNFPDALAGAAAAGTIYGPVLLVNTTGAIDTNTAAELMRLKPVRIIVLGGSSVVSDSVMQSLWNYIGTTS